MKELIPAPGTTFCISGMNEFVAEVWGCLRRKYISHCISALMLSTRKLKIIQIICIYFKETASFYTKSSTLEHHSTVIVLILN